MSQVLAQISDFKRICAKETETTKRTTTTTNQSIVIVPTKKELLQYPLTSNRTDSNPLIDLLKSRKHSIHSSRYLLI